jgi:hypothetical protein
MGRRAAQQLVDADPAGWGMVRGAVTRRSAQESTVDRPLPPGSGTHGRWATRGSSVVDPAGFEPAISSVQGRRLPARPRAQDN